MILICCGFTHTHTQRQVLAGFKSLHRAARTVFAGDDLALMAARMRINAEYKKNKLVEDASSVAELQKFAHEVENELTTTVVQAKEKQPGIYGKFGENVHTFD